MAENGDEDGNNGDDTGFLSEWFLYKNSHIQYPIDTNKCAKVFVLLQVIQIVFSDLTEITHSLISLSSLISSGPLTMKSPLFNPHPSVWGSTQVETMVFPE